SNADHDAFILFFIVLTFYFLLKAVKLQEHRKFIDSWKSLASIKAGLSSYFATSRRAVLYSLMGGMAFGCVIMAWVGFAYVAVLILAYYIIQVLVNRFKNVDSTGVTMVVLISLGFGYLLSFPVYYEQSLISVRFDIPVYLFLAALIFGFMFLVSRDYPWTLTLPAIGALFAFGIIVIDIVDPALAEAIISGQGYFVQNKLYSTIAEARAPQFSELALSFGIVSFFLSLAGLLWAMFKIPKRATAEYIFIVVWLAASIFMAISAGRFMFNAAPAFAIAAGWVTVIIVDALDLGTLRRNLSLASGSIFQVIRKNVRIRHVVGVLFLAFFLVLPNVWYSVDAGIPAETKADYDLQVYESLPSFMRAGDYDAINGTNWYFGAFGYSLPLPSYYFPAAWSWFSEQDQDTYPETSRPGYVAWWDYGFEAVQEGDHPTLADNFQNGYQVAGNVIMAQTEQDAVALFTFQLIVSGLKDGAAVESALITAIEDHGVSYAEFHDIMTMPADEVIDMVLSDQDLYGPMAEDMGAENARIVAARTLLASVGDDALTSLYSSVCEITGYEFRYFNVDSRMFPLSGTSTGIFYAPAKLSDRRVDTENGNIPYDFFTVKAVDTSGAVYELDEIPADAQIYTYTLEYQPMFYDSMFYRAMCGYSATDIGLEDDGTLPAAASGVLSGYSPMPGWNMTHFRVVYRTAYFNPYPSDEVADHRDAWRAVSFDEAQSLKAQINAGEITGVVDDSDSYYSGGTVFLKYYHGAYLNGTITTEAGNAAAGTRVTVQDEYGIPHGSVLTDSEGRYSLLAPFGNLSLVISSGDLVDSPTLQSSSLITRLKVNVTDDQSMRVKQDLDNDGVWDYIITRDYVMADSEVYGEVFWDVGGDGNYTATADEYLTDVTLTFTELTTGVTYDADASEGSYSMAVPPGKYSVFASLLDSGTVLSDQTNVSANARVELNMPIEPANLTGALSTLDNEAVAGMDVVLTDVSTGYQFTTTTDEDGSYFFEFLMPSKYQMTIVSDDQMVFSQYVSLDAGIESSRNATVYDISHLRYKASCDGRSVAYAAYRVSDAYDPESSVSASADAYGWIDLALPAGEWTLYASFSDGTGVMAGAVGLTTFSGQTTSGTVYLEEAYEVSGTLKSPRSTTVRSIFMFFQDEAGTLIPVATTSKGEFRAILPAGTYEVTAESIISQGQYSETMVVSGDMTGLLLRMDDGVTVEGYLWLDRDSSDSLDPAELGVGIGMMFTYEDGRSVVLSTYTDGSFAVSVPTGDTVTMTVEADGYSGWSYSGAWGDDANIGSLVATPDTVTVEGRLTCEGEGVRGVTVSFLPIQFVADAFTVVTGADGWFSVQVAPSDYTVEVDQDVSPTGGERYQYSANVTIRPTSQTFGLDVDAVKRVEMEGMVFGAASDIQVSIVGPESHDLALDGNAYSVYVVAGHYDIYATGLTGEQTYAGMLSAEVTADTRVFDVMLEVASTVQGRATLTTGIVNKAVTVTAVSSFGALATVESTATGSYSIDLAQDTYTISFLLEGTSTLGTQTVYVEHFHEESVVVGAADIALNPVLAERLDNTTLSGTVTGLDGSPAQATVYLTATGKYGLDLTFSTSAEGGFSASVQPGEYTMYVVRGQDRGVQLTYLTVERNTPAEADIQLEAGRYLYGSVDVAGLPASEEVSVALDDAYLTVTSGPDGRFSLLLPSGEYILSSSATRTEAGMTVSYGLSKT
ncbi:MAG: carboxypeptidase regulatory-like domain-containing protein, partial [Thermoplasmata archaeon]|nr:carboxypeptidase regulatory-like domain-containing protein [Thermoplasmata archaeon]